MALADPGTIGSSESNIGTLYPNVGVIGRFPSDHGVQRRGHRMDCSVTVIIAAYNAEGIIERAIRSALDQTCRPNVIIVDDASRDETAPTVERIIKGEPRAQLVCQATNQGPAAARNRAIELATTDWVTPLDADDAMEPERLEALVRLAGENGWDAVGDDQYRVTSWHEGAPRRRLWSDTDFAAMELTLETFVRENIHANTGYGRELGYIKPLVRKDFLQAHEIRYDPDMWLGEDYDLYTRLLVAGARFGLVNPKGYIAYDTPGSLSRKHRADHLKHLVRSDQRLLSNETLPEDARTQLKAHLLLNQKKWAWARFRERVKDRDPIGTLSSFVVPPAVLADLIGRIAVSGRNRLGRENSRKDDVRG
ncbi:MAG: glycosyltransferase family 2 protein [Pseudomonadota bacterium]